MCVKHRIGDTFVGPLWGTVKRKRLLALFKRAQKRQSDRCRRTVDAIA